MLYGRVAESYGDDDGEDGEDGDDETSTTTTAGEGGFCASMRFMMGAPAAASNETVVVGAVEKEAGNDTRVAEAVETGGDDGDGDDEGDTMVVGSCNV